VARKPGNHRLKAARLSQGFGTQEALADALGVGVRQVRRWESTSPPWPTEHHQQRLRAVLGLELDQLGFTPPWGVSLSTPRGEDGSAHGRARPVRALRKPGVTGQPLTSVDQHFAAITAAHRQMYWSVDPHHLHNAADEHVRLGDALLAAKLDSDKAVLASAIAESALLVGRIEFFDLRKPDAAAQTFARALQFAGEGEDSLLGAAILAHAAFVPGWAGERAGASDRLAAARAYARRGSAVPLMLAWLDAVEAECATRCGDLKDALRLIDRAESHLNGGDPGLLPDWMDWFTPVRLAAFKGNTLLTAGQARRARAVLADALSALPSADTKQRAVMLADLAAVDVASDDVDEACRHLGEALDQLGLTWYSAAMERVREVRRLLHPWRDSALVRDLDDRIFSWDATLTTVRS
jgi:transcriptional regulator with XRE-family HTH domain